MLSGNLKQGFLYLTGQSEQGSEEALNREKEKLRREERALQEKLEQLRKKRESLSHSITSELAPETPQKETPNTHSSPAAKPDK